MSSIVYSKGRNVLFSEDFIDLFLYSNCKLFLSIKLISLLKIL
jgi:hypothetical protein